MYKCEICGKTSNNARKIRINRSKVSKRVKKEAEAEYPEKKGHRERNANASVYLHKLASATEKKKQP